MVQAVQQNMVNERKGLSKHSILRLFVTTFHARYWWFALQDASTPGVSHVTLKKDLKVHLIRYAVVSRGTDFRILVWLLHSLSDLYREDIRISKEIIYGTSQVPMRIHHTGFPV